jgi:peptide-methionine (S)-S-oxide reductase
MFASGCFWKTQYVFSKVPGVVRSRAGYSGGTLKNPKYEQVCSNLTGHAETVSVDYDPAKTNYQKLLEVFFSKHDPTTLNRQGPDIGTQYRSVIFYTSPKQKELALAYKEKLEQSHKFGGQIVTQILPAGPFYDADDYHQNYFDKHGMVCD